MQFLAKLTRQGSDSNLFTKCVKEKVLRGILQTFSQGNQAKSAWFCEREIFADQFQSFALCCGKTAKWTYQDCLKVFDKMPHHMLLWKIKAHDVRDNIGIDRRMATL